MTDIDPYLIPASLIAQADELAGRRALDDPFGEWGSAQASTCLARLPLGVGAEGAAAQGTCEELLARRLAAVDDVPPAQRRPSHSLDRAYIADALAKVSELSA
jgi:hypothetical protein